MSRALRLAAGNAGELDASVARPRYDWPRRGVGIVHFGVGAFMRAHTAVYCDDAMAAAGGDWRIAGVSLRSGRVREQLAPQDCLYTVCELEDGKATRRLIGAIASLHVLPEAPDETAALLAAPPIRIVTLTVTEKGYCLDPATGDLDLRNPGVWHDIGTPREPQTAIGLLAAGLHERMRRGLAAPAVVSCDNLPGNGSRLRRAVLQFAGETDPALRAWIENEVAFPGTMVDRIVPATTEEDIAGTARATGLRDAAAVKCEPFRQWVIEDDFRQGRPQWEAGGALIVPGVEPYESCKLRLLNGAHSTLAYLGCLAGFTFVHELMRERHFAQFTGYMMTREISPVTPEPKGMQHADYIEELLRRFANPALAHRTRQIAMDGSQKLPQRLLATLRLQLRRDGPIAAMALALAGWMRYVLGRDDAGREIEVSDPLATRFAEIAARGTGCSPRETALAFLSIEQIFGTDLRKNGRLLSVVGEFLMQLEDAGASATVRRFVELEGEA
ncbi:MAG: mannitol dehydrogenase family protein [Woeseiaceae bacterium]